jgi:hypothetical protein
MKTALTKTVYIWLLTAILGSCLLLASLLVTEDAGSGNGNLAGIVLIAVVVCLLASIPGMALFHIAAIHMPDLVADKTIRKLLLSALALLFTWASLHTLAVILSEGRLDDSMHEIIRYMLAGYGAAFITGILIFDYSPAISEPDPQEKTAAVPWPGRWKTSLLVISIIVGISLIRTIWMLAQSSFQANQLLWPVAFSLVWLAGLVLLWKGNKAGWTLLAGLCTYSLAHIPFFLLQLQDIRLPASFLIQYFLGELLFLIILIILLQTGMRRALVIRRQLVAITILTSILLALVYTVFMQL